MSSALEELRSSSFTIEFPVTRQLPHRKTTRPAMSPLLRSLTYTQAALGPVIGSMLLQCYCALDAFRRGYGSRELFGTLGRHLLIAEELARLGYEAHALNIFESAHTALMHGGFKAEMQQRVNERKLRLSKRLRAYVRRPRMANEMHG
jgi:hypothetical protein